LAGCLHEGATDNAIGRPPGQALIDIVLAVPDSADEPGYVPGVHAFTAGTPEISRMLRSLDWLRSHDDDRDYYAAAKRDLARRQWRHVQHYAEAKTAVVQEIMARADAAAS
jgi:GrpB-like predicted nucleotidyltransferase (UPF0157 family)